MAARRSRRGRRLRGILVLLVLIIAGICFFRFQQDAIQTQTVEVTAARLPDAFDGLRIVQLSDLHGKQFGRDNEELLAAVAALKPDLIAITGDLVDQEEQIAQVPVLAQGLADIAPTYYVTGNHEWGIRQAKQVKALLEENGVIPLTNEYVLLEREGQAIALAGVDDPNGLAGQKTGDELRAEIAQAEGEIYTVLLSHRDAVETYAGWGYDLVLCGHGHGGIFRIPILDKGLLSTDRTLFPDYDGGLYPLGGEQFCFVSRGLGSNTVPIRAFRLFNRPDLPVIILHTK
jgi:predicted MPP superfamily phosphohydrolase